MKLTKLPLLLLFAVSCSILNGCTGNDTGGSDSTTSTSEEDNDNSGGDSEKTEFTVIWKNYNGEILETDQNVPAGSMPSYDGQLPKKPIDQECYYNFLKWSPDITEVTSDIEYVAIYSSFQHYYHLTPTLDTENNQITYGLYPQTNVNDEEIVAELNKLTETAFNGWYLYNENYYCKVTTNLAWTSVVFNNGDSVKNRTTYWFKCEPIVWDIINFVNGHYTLLTNQVLDICGFSDNLDMVVVNGQNVYPNNYQRSKLRMFLNNDFYNSAFCSYDGFVNQTIVRNDSLTTDSIDNSFVCEDTYDKVFPLSYQDYINYSYGFETTPYESISRYCNSTDYVRASVGWFTNVNEYKGNAKYWTRSPCNNDSTPWNVDCNGFIGDGTHSCSGLGIRAAIDMTI